ncbi:TRAP transporter substrate-binding protein [Cucumibacter marinus]|uniref:TRAP transporter substrate-binding protein n=1 Tax=Cucumibacter marinus TaxID=1121252 RepID=UPI00042683EA|nr:TRAP transporter substrate-binding protein [Cucumibacter marinus]
MLKGPARLAAIVIAATGLGTLGAAAQDYTLRLHQFLPETSTIPREVLAGWAKAIELESGGRLAVELYPSMQLGGSPADLYDQARDGVADIIWTVIGYTPGRFPTAETFELPFIIRDGKTTSRAFHRFMVENSGDEFDETHVLAFHTHGPGLIHSQKPVRSLEDMAGLKVRGGNRVINMMLEELGAVPIGMPVPAVPENLTQGVIEAATIPWQVTIALRIAELVGYHTEFEGETGWYSQTFVLTMNKQSYERLPEDLQEIIDEYSGEDLAAWMGEAMDEDDYYGRKIAEEAGNEIIVLGPDEVSRWQEVGERVTERWIGEMADKGYDGAALLARAKELIEESANFVEDEE